MKREASTMRAFAGLGLGTAPRLPVWSVQYQNSRLSERLWHKRRRWVRLSLGVVVGLVAISGFALPDHWRSLAKEDPSPIVTVLVYNYTQASIDILAGAEREAGRILGEAGLRPVWIDCLDRDSAADLQELCQKDARADRRRAQDTSGSHPGQVAGHPLRLFLSSGSRKCLLRICGASREE